MRRIAVFAGYLLIFLLVAAMAASTDSEDFGGLFYAALLLYAAILIERAVFNSRLESNFWKYVVERYRPAEEAPIKPLAGPVVIGDAAAVTIKRAFRISLPHHGRAGLADIMVSRRLFGHGESPQTRYGLRYLVLSVKLNVQTPHIFIDGRSQNRFGGRSTDLWSLTKRLRHWQKLQALEGDFYKYFDVYAVDGGQINALSIVTPDTMLALRDKGYSFDYEIHDGHLYVIHEAKLAGEAAYDALFEAVDSCLRELIPQITKHRYDNTELQLQTSQTGLSAWALLYSAGVIAWYLFKALIFIIAASSAGVLVSRL